MTTVAALHATPESAPEDAVLARRWLAAGYAAELDAGPMAVRLLGRDLVIARLDGRLLAAPDRCPHRGARLAPGAITPGPDGAECLVCPYHGLHLDADGAPVLLPARPADRLPARLGLATLPVQERHGLIWVSLSSDPVGEPPEWSAYDEPGRLRFQLQPDVWQAMPSRIVENFNDLAHFATVHAGTFGDPAHPEVPAIELRIEDDDIHHHLLMHQLDRVTLDGPLVPVQVRFSYVHRFPLATELIIDYDERRTEWIQMVVSPVGPTTSLVLQQNVRNFDLDDSVAEWHDFQAAVNLEDKVVLEGLTPRRQPIDGRASGTEPAADEVTLAVDAFTIAYRRRWTAALAEAVPAAIA
ncbi:MAG: Rieske 2Fe-2S domain-containing protein [Actinomycetota bacterium]